MTRLMIAMLMSLSYPLWALSAADLEWQPKGVDKLQLMNLTELATEAANGCIYACVSAKQAARARQHDLPSTAVRYHDQARQARDYLGRIGLVVRQKAGRTPDWMHAFANQGRVPGDGQRCVDIYQAFLTKRK
jgi:hypothetical protein